MAQRIAWMKAAVRDVEDAIEYFREHDYGDCLENDVAKTRAIKRIDAATARWYRHFDRMNALLMADREVTP